MSYYLFKITGVVQGVGFRPFIYREAVANNVYGYVKNTSEGVEILANNKEKISKILENLPPLAMVSSIKIEKVRTPIRTFDDFEIKFSEKSTKIKNAKIPADTTICDDCVSELLDGNNNRRYKYFFISCTNCGPRYSLSKSLPFDRETTSLKDFKLCEECQEEYENPIDRRFHAQTIACPKCGPKLSFYEKGKQIETNPLDKTIDLIKKGEIVSVKGIGGFSLFSLADRQTTEKLRKTLKRPYKPFAIMVRNLEMAKKFVEISDKEAEVLEGKERPIVLCKKKSEKFSHLSKNNRLGIILPYTALHHLFFEEIDQPMIITSANMPNMPIPTTKEEQSWQYILDYNREITNFSDDSIVKVIAGNPLLIRRSRGLVPNEISLPSNYQNHKEDILAVGGEMKNTFCINKENSLLLSPHLGNTAKLENFNNFKVTLNKFIATSNAKPKIILSDSHLEFNTSLWAKKYAKEQNIKHIEVQHHLAHGASVALEHNVTNTFSIVGDGLGWGSDECIWGGEVFFNQKRIGHLEYQKLVGGDIANKEPVRFLVGILEKFMNKKEIYEILSNFKSSDLNIFHTLAKENFNCIKTSSCGRILDGASILLGLGKENYYEGYLAEMLESGSCLDEKYLFLEPIIKKQNDKYILKTTELFEFLVKNLDKISKDKLASFVQLYLAKGFLEIIDKYKLTINSKKDLPITWSGGCAYNKTMTTYLLSKGVKINKNIPAGDGGISVGQVAYKSLPIMRS